MELIKPESVRIDKLFPFKNIKGRYCSFEPVIIEFPISTVSYYTQNNLFIYTNKFITSFANDLKELLVKKVFDRNVYSVTKEVLSDFYVNPLKVIKLCEVLKLRVVDQDFLKKGTQVKMVIKITGMWFGDASFGAYIVIDHLDVIDNKSHFIEASDSDEELI